MSSPKWRSRIPALESERIQVLKHWIPIDRRNNRASDNRPLSRQPHKGGKLSCPGHAQNVSPMLRITGQQLVAIRQRSGFTNIHSGQHHTKKRESLSRFHFSRHKRPFRNRNHGQLSARRILSQTLCQQMVPPKEINPHGLSGIIVPDLRLFQLMKTQSLPFFQHSIGARSGTPFSHRTTRILQTTSIPTQRVLAHAK